VKERRLNQESDTGLAAQRSAKVGTVLAAVSAFGSALTTVIGKWNLMSISPLLMNSMIFTIASVVMTVLWVPYKGRRAVFCHSAQGWRWIGAFALTSVAAIWLWWAGVQKIDPSLASFLNRVEVPIIILMGVVLLKEKFGPLEIIGGGLTLLGIVIMKLTLRFQYDEGFWLVLASSLCFGVTEYISKIALRYVDAVPMTYLRNLMIAVAFWVLFAGSDNSFSGLGEVWYGVAAVALLGPILARLLYMLALVRLELSKVAIISQLQPVYVLLIAVVALNQMPTTRELAGGFCLLAGCLLMIIGRQRLRLVSARG